MASGCAASHSEPSRVAGPAISFPGDPLPRPKPKVQPVKIELEDDGLPSQLAPRNLKPTPDEPQEPWSPNYGSVKPSGFDSGRLAAKLDAPVPAAPAYRPGTRSIDADDVIRQAIAEHEMRQR